MDTPQWDSSVQPACSRMEQEEIYRLARAKAKQEVLALNLFGRLPKSRTEIIPLNNNCSVSRVVITRADGTIAVSAKVMKRPGTINNVFASKSIPTTKIPNTDAKLRDAWVFTRIDLPTDFAGCIITIAIVAWKLIGHHV